VFIVTSDANGDAAVVLPAAAGTNINLPPSMSCYTGSVTSTVWLSIAGGSSGVSDTFCGLVFAGGGWTATMIGTVPGWLAAFVVLY
jgi:hypothetical protein